ncbi:MAG TPA: autotransporter domain-containing protein [Rhodanobacteraceae bacterium]
MNHRKLVGAKKIDGRKRIRPRPLAAAVAVALLMGLGVSVAHADEQWTGKVSIDWNTNLNWATSAVPTGGSSVIIDTISPNAPVLTSQNVTILQLTVGDQAKGALTLSGGGVLTVTGSDQYGSGMVLGQAKGSVGSVLVTGTGTVLNVNQSAQVGNDGAGSLSVTAGAIANIGLQQNYAETMIGFGHYGLSADDASGSGSITVDGAGSTLHYAGGMNLLNGTLTVSNGGVLASQSRGDSGWIDIIGFGQVGNDPSSNVSREYALDGQGTATITGAGSSWQSVNRLTVGDGGSGSLSVLDGATAGFSGGVNIGAAIPSYDYTTDPATNQTTTTLVGVKQGTGTVTVSGQGSALTVVAVSGLGNGVLVVGDSGDGTLSVDAKGSVDVAGVLTVGNQAKGTLAITGGGVMAVHGSDANGAGAILGNAVGSTGEVTVSGAGSTLTLDAGAQIGNFGSGSLTLQQGGVANIGLTKAYSETVVGLGYYGAGGPDAAKGTGTISVDGAGSTLNYAGGMNLLNGSLTVSNGGSMVSQVRSGDQGATWLDTVGYGLPADSAIAFQQLNGTAIATVSDAGSTWHSVNALDVGDGGTGTLNVLDGGKATFTGWAYLGDAALLYDSGTSTGLTQTGTGMVNVSGDGSALTIAALPAGSTGTDTGLFVGYKGDGTLSVDNKGRVDVAGVLTVGDQAKGTLIIAGGGVMAVHGSDTNGLGASFGFGGVSGSKGEVTVTGAGSTLTVDAGAKIGNGGTTVSILDGGRASFSGNVQVGDTSGTNYFGPGSEGLLKVSGTGSLLTITAAAAGGQGGAGNLIDNGSVVIDDHGSVDVAGELNVDTVGSLAVSGGGTLAVHGSDAGGMGATLGDGVTVEGSGSTLTVDAGLASSGGLTVSGGGAVVVGGHDTAGVGLLVNLDTGNGVVVSGTGSSLSVGGGARLDNANAGVSSALSITDGGAVSFHGSVLADNSDASATGSNSIIVSGAGSSLSIDASSTGGGSGVLQLGVGDSLNQLTTVTVSDGATLTATDGIEVGSRGNMIIGGNDGSGNTMAPGAVNTPSLQLDASQMSSTLIFNHSASTEENKYVFAASISGSGGIEVMSGFTELTGNSSSYTGHVGVGGGTLSVNGSLGGDIDVLPGARLQGTGTVNNVTVGGTLAPGNSPGTLHVNGNLVMQTGSVYEAQIDPATGKSDSVEVAGNVTIQPGTTLDIQSLGSQPVTPGDKIDLIQSTGNGTVQGQFDNTKGDLTTFVGYGVSYQDGKVVVGVTRSATAFASAGSTPQARALGAALDGVPADSGLGRLLFSQLTTAGQAAAAFSSMSGNVHADVRRTMLEGSQQVRDAVSQRGQLAADASGTSWWMHALDNWGGTDGVDGLSDAKTDRSGMMLGVDTAVAGSTRLGVALGADQTSWRMGKPASAHIKSRHLALYGNSAMGHFDLGYGLAFGWQDVGTNRSFMLGSVAQQLNSDSHAHLNQVFVNAGYRFGDAAGSHVEPYVALAHARLSGQNVHEHGSATALDVTSTTDSATFSTLGLRWLVGTGAVRWYGTLGWRHVFGFDRPSVQARFAQGGAAFAVQGLPMAQNAAKIDLGARFAIGKHTHVSFGYQGLISSAAHDNGANARLVVDF